MTTKVNRRDLITVALATLASFRSLRPTFAQSSYPAQPIRLVIPFPPGGVNDAVARPWAERVKPYLGTVVIENMGGAGGSIGAAAVARARPDGYTLLLGSGNTHVFNPIASAKLPYHPLRDFEPIAIMTYVSPAIAVNPAVPVRDLQELVSYARANRGNLSYASTGVGSTVHIAGELFKSLAQTPEIQHVPYRGAGPALTDLMSGHVPIAFLGFGGQVLGLHAAGKIRVLAVTSTQRSKAAPNIPTAVEAGLPGMVVQSFIGLLAPARTPAPIIEHIAQATHKAMAEPDLQQIFYQAGMEPDLDSNPERTRRFIEQELVRWTPVIRSIGLHLD